MCDVLDLGSKTDGNPVKSLSSCDTYSEVFAPEIIENLLTQIQTDISQNPNLSLENLYRIFDTHLVTLSLGNNIDYPNLDQDTELLNRRIAMLDLITRLSSSNTYDSEENDNYRLMFMEMSALHPEIVYLFIKMKYREWSNELEQMNFKGIYSSIKQIEEEKTGENILSKEGVRSIIETVPELKIFSNILNMIQFIDSSRLDVAREIANTENMSLNLESQHIVELMKMLFIKYLIPGIYKNSGGFCPKEEGGYVFSNQIQAHVLRFYEVMKIILGDIDNVYIIPNYEVLEEGLGYFRMI